MNTSGSPVVQQEDGRISFAQPDIDKVIETVERATTAELPIPEEELTESWIRIISFIRRHQRKAIWATAGLFLVFGILAFLTRYIDPHFLKLPALIVLALAAICALLVPVSEIVAGLPFVNELRRRPYAAFFRALRVTTSNDLRFLEELAQCHAGAVEYVMRHYQYQRHAQEKRGASLAGNIDRIGLFPALAAVALLWPTLLRSPFGSWLSMLVPLILAFHLLNLFGFTLQQRMDRIIVLLEMSVSIMKK